MFLKIKEHTYFEFGDRIDVLGVGVNIFLGDLRKSAKILIGQRSSNNDSPLLCTLLVSYLKSSGLRDLLRLSR